MGEGHYKLLIRDMTCITDHPGCIPRRHGHIQRLPGYIPDPLGPIPHHLQYILARDLSWSAWICPEHAFNDSPN